MKLNNIQPPKHFPSSIREWNNSIYLYNKDNINLIPLARIMSIKFIKSYFDLYNYKIEKKVRKINLKAQLRRLSCNKIHINKGEYKHTNNKTTVNLFVFNRQQHNYITDLNRKFFTKKKIYNELKQNRNLRKLNINSKRFFFEKKKQPLHWVIELQDLKQENKSLHEKLLEGINTNIHKPFKKSNNNYHDGKPKDLLDQKLQKLKKIALLLNLIFRDGGLKHKNFMLKTLFMLKKRNLWRIVKRKKYKIITNLNKRNNWYITMYVNDYYKKVISKYLRKLKLLVYYEQLLFINKSKHNYVYLQYLNQFIYNIYNKNIEYNLINLKRMHLHSDILTKSIVLKLSKKKNRLVRILKNIKKKIRVKSKNYFLNKKIKKKKLNIRRFWGTSTSFFREKEMLLQQLKYKKTTGFRVELKGRLSRRYTASRSVSKLTRKGNLLNLDSSYKKNSTVLLRGNLKSSLQYTKLKSKSRIGSYGIKGWVSGN
jgi:hypothetical protein